MHKLMGATRRRTAGVAAGLILTAGMAGGVLLTAGPAYAAGTATTTTLSATASGSSIDVTVSVAPSGATGQVTLAGLPGTGRGCDFLFVGASGSGSCEINDVAAGTYTLTATYQGSADFAGSTSNSVSVTVAGAPTPGPTSAPVFTADSPPTSVDSNSYSYQFDASGSPSFQLEGAPSWLSIDGSGMVSGYIPDDTDSFSFSVYAWNPFGHITVGPFTVFFRHHHNFEFVNLRTSLYCTSPVRTGQRGFCTLWVTNVGRGFDNFPWGWGNSSGQGFASNVFAQIFLPFQLRADFCGFSWSNFGCNIFGNTASQNLGKLFPGQTKSLTVTFTARSGFFLWGFHPGHSFFVRVVGSASAGRDNFFFTGRGTSFSVAYVRIIPRGFWW